MFKATRIISRLTSIAAQRSKPGSCKLLPMQIRGIQEGPSGPGGPGGSGPGGPDQKDDGKFASDDEGADFESDRRFSNFVLFAGALTMSCLLMASNVM
jgi:hypothetical protein